MRIPGIENQAGNARRLAGALALAILAALAFGAASKSTTPAFAGSSCANANAGINDASAKRLARAIKCLVNEERKDRGKQPLRWNSDLRKAAGRHTRTMLEENCWKHKCPGEPGPKKRILKTGYPDGASSWTYAEVFGCHATPQQMVDLWLGRKQDRQLLRKGSFRDIGVGAKKDQVGKSNCDDGNEVTYTVVVAQRD